MKSRAHPKLFRDQGLLKDISFLLIATAFVMVKGFDVPLHSVALYAPTLVLGGFAALLVAGYALTTCLRLIERLEIRLGLRRGAKY